MIKTEKYKQNIPMELREYKQWLWFKKIRKMDLKGREKTLKIPVSPITLKSIDWNNKENWTDFETAVNNIESSGCDGLSFVLSKDDPFLCIDLDNVSHDMREMFCRDFHDWSYVKKQYKIKRENFIIRHELLFHWIDLQNIIFQIHWATNIHKNYDFERYYKKFQYTQKQVDRRDHNHEF